MSSSLIVRVGAKHYALPVDRVDQIAPITDVLPVPAACAAVRGVMRVREVLVPVVHLGALMGQIATPDAAGATAVLVKVGDRRVALEVDDAEDLLSDDPEPVPAAWELPWAGGIVRHQGAVVPVLDLPVVVEQLDGQGQAVLHE